MVTPWPAIEATVQPDWIDYNGHMNVAYYVLLFDRATDAALDRLGLDAAYRATSGCSVFVVEMHVTYHQEVASGAAVQIASRLLAWDNKRLVLFHEMTSPGISGRVAANEVLCLHVDAVARRAMPWPSQAVEALAEVGAEAKREPLPTGVGRRISLFAQPGA